MDKKILVVYKMSIYDIYGKHLDDPNIKRYMENTGETGAEILKNHELHNQTLEQVVSFLTSKADIETEVIYRADLPNGINNFDLVVCVGGDGTFLETASYITSSVPIVGINSSEYFEDSKNKGEKSVQESVHKGSIGFYCGLSRTKDIPSQLEQVLRGKVSVTMLNRLEARIDGKDIGRLVLNELFIAHENPAAVTMCKVTAEKKGSDNYVEDEQGNSGIIIATPQQCWAIKAGGEALPLDSRMYQIVARESYRGEYDVIVVDDKETDIMSRTRRGKIYVDGAHNVYDFTLGAHLKVRVSDKPLYVLGFNGQRRDEHVEKSRRKMLVKYL